jgi:hypothetical protein
MKGVIYAVYFDGEIAQETLREEPSRPEESACDPDAFHSTRVSERLSDADAFDARGAHLGS